jgi:hypothetical protein
VLEPQDRGKPFHDQNRFRSISATLGLLFLVSAMYKIPFIVVI